jgi:hypothetical protein
MGTMLLGFVVIMVGFATALAYPVLQVRAFRRMRGAWLLLAAVPLVPMAYIIGVTALALGKGSNLWPILLIFTAPFGAAYLFLLGMLHRRFTTSARTPDQSIGVRHTPGANK